MTMKTSRWRNRRVLWLGGATASAVALLVAGVTSTVAAQPTSLAGTTSTSSGYPPPKGMFAPFTNCPLKDTFMQQTVVNTACTAGEATSGTITIGNITTQVTEPVNVQFGFGAPIDHSLFPSPAIPPLAGPSAITTTKPDLIPESLTTALGCSTATDPTIQNMCTQAQADPADNQVFALAQDAGNIQNFDLFTWEQPMKFKLINPLLGNNCYIGTDSDPVVLHPQLQGTPGTTLTVQFDPNVPNHDAGVLALNDVNAVDTTFSAPTVVDCGPGGAADYAVNHALNVSSGLPAASGNSLTLNGNFDLAVNQEFSDSTLPQPQNDAANLLAEFKASTSNSNSVKHKIIMSQFKAMLHFTG